MLVTPQIQFPRSAPIALGGTTDAVLLATLRGVISARVTAGSVVLQLLRWLDGVGGWEIVRATGQPVAIRPSIFSADGVSAGEFSAGSGYYTALLTTAPPDGDLANLAAVDIADVGAGGGGAIDAAEVEYTPTDPGNWDGPPTQGQEAWDELASRVRTLEDDPSLRPYESVTTDDAASAGQVARRVASGNIELATGGALGDGDGTVGFYGAAVSGGGTAQLYKTGSRCPVAGLPLGVLWRSNTGTAVLYGSLVPGEFTNRLGYSDGTAIDVNVGPEEEVI